MRRVWERRIGRRLGAAAGMALCMMVLPMTAEAQPARARTWSIDIHGGTGMGSLPSGGSRESEFPVGATFLMETEPDRLPSRAVSSWIFGDGAALLNDVINSFRAASGIDFARLVPLDAMLTSRAAARRNAVTAGVRVGRRLTSRFGLEFSVDWAQAPLEFTGEARDAIEATSLSFDQTFTGMFEVAPVSGLSVTSRADFRDASTSQLSVTGAVTVGLGRMGAVAPYAVAGGGMARTSGDAPQVIVGGNYQFQLFGSFPFSETDTVTIRLTERDTRPIGVVGGGVVFELGARHGLKLDVRAHVGSSRAATVVSAAPSVTPRSPDWVLPTNTSPGIQFSTNSGIRSSLGDAMPELTTFRGSGLETHLLVTAGYTFRF